MNGADALLVPDWPAPPNVRACVTTRLLEGRSLAPFDRFNLGARCGDAAQAVAANREALATLLDLPASPRWLRQVHGVAVHEAQSTPGGEAEPEADAACTRAAGVVLAVLTADCLPVLFCSDDGGTIAAAHAGWRGLAAGVLEATLARMAVAPAHVIAWLGPAIGAVSYEVGDEVRAAFVTQDAAAAAHFSANRAGHWWCDLAGLARHRLAAIGVRGIHGGGVDTRTDPRFYSFRRDPVTGRFASLIWRSA